MPKVLKSRDCNVDVVDHRKLGRRCITIEWLKDEEVLVQWDALWVGRLSRNVESS